MGSLSNRAANDRSPLTRMIKDIIMRKIAGLFFMNLRHISWSHSVVGRFQSHDREPIARRDAHIEYQLKSLRSSRISGPTASFCLAS